MNLAQAVDNGNELEILIETRRIISNQLSNCENGHDISSLADKMVKISERITELEKQQKPKRRTTLDAVRKIKK